MPMNDLQANAAALMAADTNLDADWLKPCGAGKVTVSASEYAPFTIKAPPMQPKLRMYSEPGKYGTLRFDENGMFQFEGDASASAQVLFAEMKRLSGK